VTRTGKASNRFAARFFSTAVPKMIGIPGLQDSRAVPKKRGDGVISGNKFSLNPKNFSLELALSVKQPEGDSIRRHCSAICGGYQIKLSIGNNW
jgi:hypothetical protein